MAYNHHIPVLCAQALKALNIEGNQRFIDATFGRGGHSGAILNALGPNAHLLGIDQDLQAASRAEELFSGAQNFSFVHANFSQLTQIVTEQGWMGQVDGILMDLGVSSPQLDDPERGFSFMRDGPLDMRMDTTRGQTAAEWLAGVPEHDLANVLWRLGEERYSRQIAAEIVKARAEKPILRTQDLVNIIEETVWKREKHKHPATRTFLAIRLKINHELDVLSKTLDQALESLAVGGRLAVISFHSLEDRIVKRFIQGHSAGNEEVHILHSIPKAPRIKRVGKAILPGKDDISENVRARSAVLRVAEKLF